MRWCTQEVEAGGLICVCSGDYCVRSKTSQFKKKTSQTHIHTQTHTKREREREGERQRETEKK